jgi:hypothetical protein
VLFEEDKMTIPLVLDDSNPPNMLMTLLDSNNYKQVLGKVKHKQHNPPSDASDLDETP